MPLKTRFVDEPWLIWTDEALVDLLAVIVIDHVLLQMRLVAEDFPAERAGNFVDDVSVPEVIFEDALRGIGLVADVTAEDFFDLHVLQPHVSTAIAHRRVDFATELANHFSFLLDGFW
jgi:hypothetical protein